MSTELATIATQPPMIAMELTAKQVMGQVQLIQDVIKKAMKEGEHYGKIPGCGDKPALFKAGAEKLALTFRLAPTYRVITTELGNGHREHSVTCELRHIITGQYLGSGVGSCSTMERKYRWRTAKLPDTILDIDVPKMYWDAKKANATFAELGRILEKTACEPGRYGVKKVENEWKITKRGEGSDEPIENPDLADQYNTVLKMAKKRAHVDATLTVLAASDCFTQDIEERVDIGVEPIDIPVKESVGQAEATPESISDRVGVYAKNCQSMTELTALKNELIAKGGLYFNSETKTILAENAKRFT